MRSDGELALLVEANLWAMHRDYSRVPGAVVHDEPRLLSYTVPTTSSWLNGASFSHLDRRTADRAVAGVTSWIVGQRRNAKWHVGPATRPADLPDRLAGAGFVAAELEIPGMVVGIGEPPIGERAATRVPAELKVERVRKAPQLVRWLEAFDMAFAGALQPGGHPWLEPFRHLVLNSETPYGLFVGSVDDQPVATALAFLGAGAVGLYGIGTLPSFRGRGYGSAMTHVAMEYGRAHGLPIAILHASELGEPVYRRIGFRQVCTVSQWLKTASA